MTLFILQTVFGIRISVMTKNNSFYISGMNNGSPVAMKESNKATLASIKDTATVFATTDRLPSYPTPKASIISRTSKRPGQKQQKENDGLRYGVCCF
jgi:hypothetical protein